MREFGGGKDSCECLCYDGGRPGQLEWNRNRYGDSPVREIQGQEVDKSGPFLSTSSIYHYTVSHAPLNPGAILTRMEDN